MWGSKKEKKEVSDEEADSYVLLNDKLEDIPEQPKDSKKKTKVDKNIKKQKIKDSIAVKKGKSEK